VVVWPGSKPVDGEPNLGCRAMGNTPTAMSDDDGFSGGGDDGESSDKRSLALSFRRRITRVGHGGLRYCWLIWGITEDMWL
jgi:hypothetical protein